MGVPKGGLFRSFSHNRKRIGEGMNSRWAIMMVDES